MKQEKLEAKVREIFEREDFKIEKGKAVKPGTVLTLGVYSSEKYSEEDVDLSKDRVFVDEGLDVDGAYVIEEDREYDLPSFELIGDIAVVNDLSGRGREDVVEAILAHHDVKTILLKASGLSGEFRVGEYEKLYGNETETIHKEHGKKLKVDPTQVYYSERFSTERKRVADQISGGENVLVMFAGVGPFAVLAAEKAQVVAVEKNVKACKYLKENVKLNGFEDRIQTKCGDVEDVVPGLEEGFDRVVMPLPESALEFLDLALEVCNKGAVIHLYAFVENRDFESIEFRMDEVFSEKDLNYEILDRVRCGYKSPSEDRYCFDIKVS